MIIPWMLAGVTAAWFGFIAKRAERNPALWALAGGFFALTVTTIVWGLGKCRCHPVLRSDRVTFQLRWTGAALVIVLLCALGQAMYLKRKSEPREPNQPSGQL